MLSLLQFLIQCTFFISFLYLQTTNATPCHPTDLLSLQNFSLSLTSNSSLSSWRDPTLCCQWDGVLCSPVDTTTGYLHVTSLSLSSHNLSGPVSHSLSNIQFLQFLDLSFNSLSGTIDFLSEIPTLVSANLSSNLFNGSVISLSNLPNLVYLNVSNNSLSGQVGPDLCLGAPAIRVLDLSFNGLTGALPDGRPVLCNGTIQELYLGSNSLSGEIPDSLFDLISLERLSLFSNDLSGYISTKLGLITSLKLLDISVNRFSGMVPDVFQNLTKVEHLIMHSNSLSGPLPSSFSNLVQIKELDLRNNSLSGRVEIDFTGMLSLQSLDLATNRFTGPLPTSLSNCMQLKTLSLAKNGFTGQVPTGYANLSSLFLLSLSNNSIYNISGALVSLQNCKNLTTLILTKNFHGEVIPGSGFAGFENLEILALGNCGLTGLIPDSLARCKKLEVLDLSWNRLTGVIPGWISELDYLTYLDISNNSLSGEIPKQLTQLKSLVSGHTSPNMTYFGLPLYVKRNRSTNGLQYNQLSSFPPSLYLNNNGLNGSIWPEFGNLKLLHVLDLSHNGLTGHIPHSLADMENLEVLDLSFNQLNGSIPASLSKLTFLSKFSVAHNHLEGKVPTDGQFFSFSNSSYEGNPGLCKSTSGKCNSTYMQLGTTDPGILQQSGKRNNLKGSILGVTISLAIGIVLLLTFVLLHLSRKDETNQLNLQETDTGSVESPDPNSKPVIFFQNSDTKDITIHDLLKSTSNFDQANIIGCGGFGLVYKAYLHDGSKVAVKRLSGDCGQMEREFRAEIETLSRAQHPNLVSLKGYCKYGSDRLLIYSYMENGSLDYWLHEKPDGGSHLKWPLRLKIAQGSARGLSYLHKSCDPNIVHRDVKSSNILLDEKFEAHLADFGLSRFMNPYATHVTTDLVGTLGYIPPEYSQALMATLKGDVFSFGVVLLELLTGRRPIDICRAKGSRDLVSWVCQMRKEKNEEVVFDSLIWGKLYEKELMSVLEIACRCINSDPRSRPGIEQVVAWLDAVGVDE
ncbi:phytosulfokine receptor 2 [Carex littledalei]|uniref:non-specific serine/threonine protein kinase n=1 Tax=Carex littledalei TaxID=544730 RepID=A0A833QNR4_9POAL|nr:phytosulfokine receptor 2 [Carex littledalei]